MLFVVVPLQWIANWYRHNSPSACYLEFRSLRFRANVLVSPEHLYLFVPFAWTADDCYILCASPTLLRHNAVNRRVIVSSMIGFWSSGLFVLLLLPPKWMYLSLFGNHFIGWSCDMCITSTNKCAHRRQYVSCKKLRSQCWMLCYRNHFSKDAYALSETVSYSSPLWTSV